MCFHTVPTRETETWRAPELAPDDLLIFDEPGRCKPQVNGTGSTDYHSHHLRLVERRSHYVLLVRHGAGDEAFTLGGLYTRIAGILSPMDSDARYLMLYALYRAHSEAKREGRDRERARWEAAAREKRIKTRKLPRQGVTKVWIVGKEA